MRVLVVGGAGYIGSVCGAHLVEHGHHVVVLDDLSTGHPQAAPGPLVQGDVRDRARTAELLRAGRFDAVMHFAARAVVGDSVRRPTDTFSVNVGGTAALVDAMNLAGVRSLVFSSTCAVYGEPLHLPLTEDHPHAPVSPYGESKSIAERILGLAREREGLRVTALRYFNAAGAASDGSRGEAHHPETHLVPLALAAAAGASRPLTLFGDDWPTRDGTCVRDYVHVEDLAEAHRLALTALVDGEAGSAYNLGTGRGATVREVLQAVERVTGRPVPHGVEGRRAGDPAELWADGSRARSALGWRPKHDLERIVADAARWAAAPRYGGTPV
ncbi:MAG: UDP-glucose 4-epimerase GalE [Myxococcota bacterium]